MTGLAMPTGQTLLELLDPRGRCNARGLQRLTVCLLVLQTAVGALLWSSGAELGGAVATALNVAFCWIGFTAVSKRLHDIGRTAWWFLAAATIWFLGAVLVSLVLVLVLGEGAVDEGTAGHTRLVVAMVAPVMLTLLWLHFVPGNAGDNRFGPVPADYGFSMPSSAAAADPTLDGPEAAHAA